MSQKHDSVPGDDHQRRAGADVAAQLRALADGELNDTDRHELERRLGEGGAMESATRFERGLRDAVGRVMQAEAPRAPDALREQIRLAMETAPSHEFESEEPVRIMSGVSGPWGLMAAAAIVLTVGAALLMRGGLSGAPQGGPQGLGAQSASILGAADAEVLVNFIKNQHESCAMFGERFNKKMVARTEAEAAREAIELLNEVPTALQLGAERLAAAGYEFAGLGRCRVPGAGRSAHLIYKSHADGGVSVSLFIQEDTGSLALEQDRFYSSDKAEQSGTTLSVWKNGRLIYYLFTPNLEHAPPARKLFGAPALRGALS